MLVVFGQLVRGRDPFLQRVEFGQRRTARGQEEQILHWDRRIVHCRILDRNDGYRRE